MIELQTLQNLKEPISIDNGIQDIFNFENITNLIHELTVKFFL